MLSINVWFNDLNKKKCNFMIEVKESFGIFGVNIVCERVEVLGRKEDFREKFDFVFVWVVDKLNVLCEYVFLLLKIGGVFLV